MAQSKSEQRRLEAIEKGRKSTAKGLITEFTKHSEVLKKNGFAIEARSVDRVIARLDAFNRGVHYLDEKRKERRTK